MNATYVPGDRAVAVGHRVVVMAARDRAAEVAALVERSPAPLEVLSALSGGDVAHLPDFAAVVLDGTDLVVMARGGYTIRCGTDAWSGRDAATWREYRVEAGAAVTIEDGNAAEDLELPVATGVVLATRVTWQPSDAPASPVAEPSAEVATPTRDPEFTLDEPQPEVEAEPESEEGTGFDESVGLTVQGRRAPAPPGVPGDHDGRTITTEQLQQLRAQRSPDTAEVDRPGIDATLTVSGGETVDLAQPVIIGRSPRADQKSSAQLPQLVVVDDPYVSGTHVEVAVEDGAVVATDRSTNGTILIRPDGESERLPKDVPTALGDGCVLGLSEDVTATIAVRGVAG